MKTYTYSEVRERLWFILERANREGGIQIRTGDGQLFVLRPVAQKEPTPAVPETETETASEGGSPLDVPGAKANLRPGETLEWLKEAREEPPNRWLRD